MAFQRCAPLATLPLTLYKEDTLRRLEDEQSGFEDFLQRLRDAKDKAEFDEFIDNHAKVAASSKETENA